MTLAPEGCHFLTQTLIKGRPLGFIFRRLKYCFIKFRKIVFWFRFVRKVF